MGFRRIRLILMLRMIEGECGLQTQSSMNCKIMINNLLLFNLAVLDFSDDILRWLNCANLLVKNVDYMHWREGAIALLFVKLTSLGHLIIIDCNQIPVLQKPWVRVAENSKVLHLVKVLENHQILPSWVLTEGLEVIVVHLNSATIDNFVFKSQNWIIKVQVLGSIID